MSEIKTIKIMIKEPNKEPYIKEIEDTLENLQAIVGGLIDCVEMPGVRNVDIYFDDEGLLKHKPGNIWLAGTGDCIKGTCYMVGFDPKEGENISLTYTQIKQCERYVKTFELPKGADLYADYFWLVPTMYKKSEQYLRKPFTEM